MRRLLVAFSGKMPGCYLHWLSSLLPSWPHSGIIDPTKMLSMLPVTGVLHGRVVAAAYMPEFLQQLMCYACQVVFK